jgi:hypothetical protein
LLARGRWFSPASSTTKTGRHDIAEILLKVALNTKKINQSLNQFKSEPYRFQKKCNKKRTKQNLNVAMTMFAIANLTCVFLFVRLKEV